MGLNMNPLNPGCDEGYLVTLLPIGRCHGTCYFTRSGKILFGLDTIQEVTSPTKRMWKHPTRSAARLQRQDTRPRLEAAVTTNHLPTALTDKAAAEVLQSWTNTLLSYSTGKCC